jgi:hypothetical protein
MNSPQNVATIWTVINDKQMRKTKEKDYRVSNEKKDEESIDYVEE